jgi:long-chain acyl-CoA synthetase
LAEDDEILVKGRNVFMGYYKDPVSTESDLQNGWLYSGDLGKFDEDGFLNIIGRKKEIIITSGGKNIAPKNIEAALKNVDLVSQAVVIGEQRRYLTALLTLDPDAAHHFAQANGLAGQTIHDNPKVLEHLQQEIDQKVNALFARVEHVRGFKVLPRDFTVEDGELTPTLKIKRRIVNQNFSDEIEALYEE